jgi:hypothetical protein
MVAGATISGDLSDAAWLEALRDIVKREGTVSDLGAFHSAVFVEKSRDVLFVAFETVLGIRAGDESGLPMAFDVCERRGWSHLTLVSKRHDWFRDRRVIRFFDQLADAGFFDSFSRVVFYGAGMCGYAAAAFSVSAPGATALLVAPQATLDRTLTGWDGRFPSARRLSFGPRYGYAPDLLEAAEAAYVIYDPDEIEDAMHASLFRGTNVHHLRYRRGGAGSIEADLRAMSLISRTASRAAEGTLTLGSLAALFRARRRHVPYLRALLSRVIGEDRPELTVRLCRAVLAEQPLPRFQKQLELAERQLGIVRIHGNAAEDDGPDRDAEGA